MVVRRILGVGGTAGTCAGFLQSSPFGTPVVAIDKEFVARADVTTHLWTLGAAMARAAGAVAATLGAVDARLVALRARAEAALAATPEPEGPALPMPDGEAPEGAVREAAAPPPPLPAGTALDLYDVAHARAGDKGQMVNVSLVAYEPWEPLFDRILAALEPDLPTIFAPFLDAERADDLDIRVFRMRHLAAANITVSPVLDGGVSLNRRIDIHGKSFSDVLLSHSVVLGGA